MVGGGGWVVVVCKPILVSSLSLGQAEQFVLSRNFAVMYAHFGYFSVSANLKVVHIGPKHVHIGHVLVQITQKMG